MPAYLFPISSVMSLHSFVTLMNPGTNFHCLALRLFSLSNLIMSMCHYLNIC